MTENRSYRPLGPGGDTPPRPLLFHANSITGTYQTLGRGVLSSTAVNNRRGYAGYEHDPTFEGAPTSGRHLYHVRHRVYDAGVGRWTRRDPLGYLDGMSLYEYVESAPVENTDPKGLLTRSCAGGGCAAAYPPDSPRWPGGPGPGIGPRLPEPCPTPGSGSPPTPGLIVPIPKKPPWTPPPGKKSPPRIDPDWIDCFASCRFTAERWQAACKTCTKPGGMQACVLAADTAMKGCQAACISGGEPTDRSPADLMWKAMCETLKKCKAGAKCGTKLPPSLVPPRLRPPRKPPQSPPGGGGGVAVQ